MHNLAGYIYNTITEVFDAAWKQVRSIEKLSNRRIRRTVLQPFFHFCLVWNELGSVTVGLLTKTQSSESDFGTKRNSFVLENDDRTIP